MLALGYVVQVVLAKYGIQVGETADGVTAAPDLAFPEPVDWGLAQRVAQRVAGRDPLETSYLAASLPERLRRCHQPGRGSSSASSPDCWLAGSPARARVLDRQRWVRGQHRSASAALLMPFTRRVASGWPRAALAPVGRAGGRAPRWAC